MTRKPTVSRVVAALCVAALVVPVPGASAQPRDRAAVDAELGEAREGLQDTERRRKATVADLEAIEARRAALNARLTALTTDLRAAEASLAAAERELARTQADLDEAQRHLDAVRERLERHRQVFNTRVRESFKRGNTQTAAVLLDLEEIADFARAMKYVQRVMAHDRDRLTLVANLEREVAARTVQLDALLARQARLAATAAADRDRVAVLVADQAAVAAEAAAEADRHRAVLAELEADRDSYVALVDSLEAESARIEQELRRRAEQERRRRAEEEAARQAARDRAGRSGAEGSPGEGSGEDEPSRGAMFRPATGRITSGYGWRSHPIYGDRRFHAGIDFAGSTGTPFYAGDDGVVVSAGWRGGYGNAVVIDHGRGLATLYAHASVLYVTAGQQVSRGETIGAIGSTGYSTGPHLHWEVRQDGEPQNPREYL